LRLVLDASVRLYDGGRVLVSRGRIIRLTDPGPAALRALLADTATPAQRRLGDQLVRAGMAHPRPRPQHRPTTIVIPVRDRRLRPLAESEPRPVVVVDDGSRTPIAGAVRREVSGGPGAARNTGLEQVETELVAFLDSDTQPPPGWIERLAGHFEDPTVAAVAPRVTGKLLDMGGRPAEVRPGTPVPYVPTAAILMRTAALGPAPFDPALRYGEDVDLIWRLLDQGWRVRYDPSVTVAHEDQHVFRRRFLYGTSAAPLKQRHPDKLKHLVIRPWPLATLALLAARRPGPAAAAYAFQTLRLAWVLRRKGVPAQLAKLAGPYGAGVLSGHILSKIRGLPTISGPSI
jgi:mycofactocin system glycosyltransferase